MKFARRTPLSSNSNHAVAVLRCRFGEQERVRRWVARVSHAGWGIIAPNTFANRQRFPRNATRRTRTHSPARPEFVRLADIRDGLSDYGVFGQRKGFF